MTNNVNSIDDFMATSFSSGGSSKDFDLKKLKEATVWLHTGVLPQWLTKHDFPRRVELQTEKGPEVQFWGRGFNCHDAPHARAHDRLSPLKFYRDRDRSTWSRVHRPQDCPNCKATDYVDSQIRSGNLAWYQPLFVFEDALCEHPVEILAGGFSNMNTRTPKDDVKRDARSKNIDLSELWKQSGAAKMQWVLVLVDEGAPTDVCITVEPQVLGEKLRDAMALARNEKNLGKEGGDPLRNPYPFFLKYDDTKDFSARYSVEPLMMQAGKIPAAVKPLITSAPPDISNYLAPGNAEELRETMEKYAVFDLPFDRFFDTKGTVRAQVPAQVKAPAAPAPEPAKIPTPPPSTTVMRTRTQSNVVDDAPPIAAKPSGRRRMIVEEPLPEPPNEVEMEACLACNQLFPADAKECPHCGEKYI